MNMYGKIFDSLWKGSMRGKCDVQLVFIHLICNCDQDGNCDYLPQVIADDTGMTLEHVQIAITELEAPDPLSRTPDEQGRRIVRLSTQRSWGWRIVNHILYRDKLSEAWKKERNAERQRRFKEKRKSNAQSVTANTPSVSAFVDASVSDKGDARGNPVGQYTLQECLDAGDKLAMKREDIEACFHYWNAAGWMMTGNRPVRSLTSCLSKWKANQSNFEKPKIVTAAGRPKTITELKTQLDMLKQEATGISDKDKIRYEEVWGRIRAVRKQIGEVQ
jgi:hypothetical protein